MEPKTWLLYLGAPLVVGALWGAWRGRRDRFSFVVLLVAPIFTAFLLTIVASTLSVFLNPAPIKPAATKLLHWMVVAVFFGIIFFLYGTVPALAGCAAAQWGKRRLFRREAGIRQAEPAEENPS